MTESPEGNGAQDGSSAQDGAQDGDSAESASDTGHAGDRPNQGDQQSGPDAGPGSAEHGSHARVAGELRALVMTALDRVEPALERLRKEAAAGSGTTGATGAATCTGCPVCTVMALVRGDRPESTARLAEQLTGLLTVLRAALEEGDPAAGGARDAGQGAPAADQAAPAGRPQSGAGPGRRVQQIPIERVGG